MMQNHYLENMSALRREIHRRGWYNTASQRIVSAFLVHLLIVIGGSLIFLASDDVFAQVLGIMLTALGNVGIASNSHTATHNAAYKRSLPNRIHSIVGGPLVLGLSSTYWHHKHVANHHRAPNVLGIDGDIDLGPIFLLTDTQRESVTGWKALWYRSQWFFAPIMIGLAAFGMNVNGWFYLLRRCLNGKVKWMHVIDLLALSINILMWIALARYSGFSAIKVSQLFAFRSLLLGYAFFAVLAPAHYPDLARSYINTPENLKNNVELVTNSTLNFRAGKFAAFFLSGLHYQIEHHLFPNVSHIYYPELSNLMKQYCQRHGYLYQEISWTWGIAASYGAFIRPKKVQRSLEKTI